MLPVFQLNNPLTLVKVAVVAGVVCGAVYLRYEVATAREALAQCMASHEKTLRKTAEAALEEQQAALARLQAAQAEAAQSAIAVEQLKRKLRNAKPLPVDCRLDDDRLRTLSEAK